MILLGDGFLILALLVWLTVAVGPWWLGGLLFVTACALNGAHEWLRRRVAQRSTGVR